MGLAKINLFLLTCNKGDLVQKYQMELKGLTATDISHMEREVFIIPTGEEEQYIVTEKGHNFAWDK